jgi:hypothetical protein
MPRSIHEALVPAPKADLREHEVAERELLCVGESEVVLGPEKLDAREVVEGGAAESCGGSPPSWNVKSRASNPSGLILGGLDAGEDQERREVDVHLRAETSTTIIDEVDAVPVDLGV